MSGVCRSLSKFVDRNFCSGSVSDTLSSASPQQPEGEKENGMKREETRGDKEKGEGRMGEMWPVPWAHVVTCLPPPVDRHCAAWEGFPYSEQITCFRASNDFWGWVLRFQQNDGN